MTSQLDISGGAGGARRTVTELPEGFRYESELIGPADEAALLASVRELPFREFEFHGYTGKRRVISFGWHYDFSGRQLRKADDIPDFLLPLRQTAAAFAGVAPEQLQHVLVTEYGPGAGIGWHRDKAVFGEMVGVSLLSPCVLRLRRKVGERKWERANVTAEPRSGYLLSGPSRSGWERRMAMEGSLVGPDTVITIKVQCLRDAPNVNFRPSSRQTLSAPDTSAAPRRTPYRSA